MERTRLPAGVPIRSAVERTCGALADLWVSQEQAGRVGRFLLRFERFAKTAYGINDLGEVTPEVAEAFIWATDSQGGRPSNASAHLRRTALRLLFRVARQTNPVIGDPTLDLTMPARSPRLTRPLTAEEVTLCRVASTWSIEDTRRSTAWALAEATCRTGELPFVRIGDVDLVGRRVWLHGGRRQTARWGELTGWGCDQLDRRLMSTADIESSMPLLYRGSDPSEAGRASTSTVLLDVLRRAGLTDDAAVRPQSITGWAGRQILDRTGRIDLVARGLGIGSLDRAASMIDWSWRDEDT